MAREEYRVLVPTFWTDPEIKKKLTRDQKHLAIYYFTSPHSKGSLTGVYYCPIEYAAAEADLTTEEIRRFLVGPLRPFVSYDEETEEVFVHAFAKHNVGDELKIGPKGEDNRIEAVRRQVQAIHSNRLVRGFLARYNEKYRLGLPLPENREAPSEPLPSPSEAIPSHPIPSHPSSVLKKEPAVAAASDDLRKLPHGHSSCMKLVVDRLYLGHRPSERDMSQNGSILKLYGNRHGYDRMARVIEGLALRRDRGELYGVRSNQVVSLKWIHTSKIDINQLAVSEDALYQGNAPPRKGKGGMADAGAVAASIVGRIGS